MMSTMSENKNKCGKGLLKCMTVRLRRSLMLRTHLHGLLGAPRPLAAGMGLRKLHAGCFFLDCRHHVTGQT